jgi:hypothetical protein
VSRFYREGKLGGPKRIEADIAGLEELGEARTSFLRGDGTMVPWAEMSQDQRFTFLNWVDLPRVNRIVGDAENEAVEDAARRAEPRCEAAES